MARDEVILPSAARAVGDYTLDFTSYSPGAVIVVEKGDAGVGTVAMSAQVKNPITGTVDTSNITGVSITAFTGNGEIRRLVCFPGLAAVADEAADKCIAGGVQFKFTVAGDTSTFSAYVRSIS